ncbi:MAG: hypothetical protein AAFR61_11205 [Bacteroidota bacterium]
MIAFPWVLSIAGFLLLIRLWMISGKQFKLFQAWLDEKSPSNGFLAWLFNLVVRGPGMLVIWVWPMLLVTFLAAQGILPTGQDLLLLQGYPTPAMENRAAWATQTFTLHTGEEIELPQKQEKGKLLINDTSQPFVLWELEISNEGSPLVKGSDGQWSMIPRTKSEARQLAVLQPGATYYVPGTIECLTPWTNFEQCLGTKELELGTTYHLTYLQPHE